MRQNRLSRAALMMTLIGYCVTATPAALRADDSIVGATGIVHLKVPATTLRVTAEIKGSGKDLAAAVAALAKRKTAVNEALATLKPIAGSVTIGNAVAGSALSETSDEVSSMRQMQMQMSRRNQNPGPKEESVTALVKFSLELPTGDPDALLVGAKQLEDKVKAILKTEATPAAMTDEEKERAEEMQAMMASSGMDNNGVIFQYVAPVSEQEVKKATAEAFAQARAKAVSLAEAAGMTVTRTKQLGAALESEMSTFIQQMRRAQFGSNPEAAKNEAVGTAPGMLNYDVVMPVTFVMN